MNVRNILDYSEYFSQSGMSLNMEQKALLQNSLILLQTNNQFKDMYYWGQIFGNENDYFISFGFVNDALTGRKYFYSTNLIEWGLLPYANKQCRGDSLIAVNQFQGDPLYLGDLLDESIYNGHECEIKQMKEEDRLSAVIQIISEESEIVARGQLLKLPDGRVVDNDNFFGLELAEAKRLESYQHYRHPQQTWNTNLLTRPDYNYSIDFLDTIDTDIPLGCWTITTEKTERVVYLKNMYWPGMTYFHKVKSQVAGFTYIGNGKKNIDVPFMI